MGLFSRHSPSRTVTTSTLIVWKPFHNIFCVNCHKFYSNLSKYLMTQRSVFILAEIHLRFRISIWVNSPPTHHEPFALCLNLQKIRFNIRMYCKKNYCLIFLCGHFFVNNLEATYINFQATELENGKEQKNETILHQAKWRCRKTIQAVLCLWFRVSLICINNCPTRCNTKQSIYYSASSLYMFRGSTTPIIRSTQNCNYSLRYWSYFCAATSLQRGQASLATLEGDVPLMMGDTRNM